MCGYYPSLVFNIVRVHQLTLRPIIAPCWSSDRVTFEQPQTTDKHTKTCTTIKARQRWVLMTSLQNDAIRRRIIFNCSVVFPQFSTFSSPIFASRRIDINNIPCLMNAGTLMTKPFPVSHLCTLDVVSPSQHLQYMSLLGRVLVALRDDSPIKNCRLNGHLQLKLARWVDDCCA